MSVQDEHVFREREWRWGENFRRTNYSESGRHLFLDGPISGNVNCGGTIYDLQVNTWKSVTNTILELKKVTDMMKQVEVSQGTPFESYAIRVVPTASRSTMLSSVPEGGRGTEMGP